MIVAFRFQIGSLPAACFPVSGTASTPSRTSIAKSESFFNASSFVAIYSTNIQKTLSPIPISSQGTLWAFTTSWIEVRMLAVALRVTVRENPP
jgi:hypothetical protein